MMKSNDADADVLSILPEPKPLDWEALTMANELRGMPDELCEAIKAAPDPRQAWKQTVAKLEREATEWKVHANGMRYIPAIFIRARYRAFPEDLALLNALRQGAEI